MEPSKKYRVMLSLLARSPSVFVHIDARGVGVVLPEYLRGRPLVVLQIGHNMPVPIPDLQITDSGVTGTLSFRGTACLCVMPWTSVKALVCEDGDGFVFDLEWAKEFSSFGTTAAPAAPAHRSERPYLRRVK